MAWLWYRARIALTLITVALLIGGASFPGAWANRGVNDASAIAVSKFANEFDRYAYDGLADQYATTPMNRGWRLTHTGWGETDIETLALVLSETADVLFEHVAEERIADSQVAVFSWNLLPPNEAYGGRSYTSGEVFNVYLKPYGNDWRRYVSVYAHELCHVLDANSRTPTRYRWFEETLCQVASLYVLEKLAKRWSTSGDAWQQRYAPILHDYHGFLLSRQDTELPAGYNLASWFHTRAGNIGNSWEDYSRNDIIARNLFPHFREHKGAWEAMTYLKRLGNAGTLENYLDRWHAEVPYQHRSFVRNVAAAFGLQVTDQSLTGR